jgi:hypothetical protein
MTGAGQVEGGSLAARSGLDMVSPTSGTPCTLSPAECRLSEMPVALSLT